MSYSKTCPSRSGPPSVHRKKNAYTFQLPYLYLESKDASGSLYTEHPPLLASKAETDVAEEFRCKALSDPELNLSFPPVPNAGGKSR